MSNNTSPRPTCKFNPGHEPPSGFQLGSVLGVANNQYNAYCDEFHDPVHYRPNSIAEQLEPYIEIATADVSAGEKFTCTPLAFT